MPRNIDPAVGGLENVSLYNIDDLEGLARQAAQARERELVACSQILNAHVMTITDKLCAEDSQWVWGAARSEVSTRGLVHNQLKRMLVGPWFS